MKNWNAGDWEYTTSSGGMRFFYETYDDGTDLKKINPLAFTVYPNPVADQKMVYVATPDKITLIQFFDNLGRLVLQHQPMAHHSLTGIDVSTLKSGMYAVQVIDIQGNKNSKYVVVK